MPRTAVRCLRPPPPRRFFSPSRPAVPPTPGFVEADRRRFPYGFTTAEQKDGALTVWVDATRIDAAKAYQKAHPDVKLDIVTYDGDANGSNYLPDQGAAVQPDRQGLAGRRLQHPEQRGVLGGQGDGAASPPR